MKTLCVSLETAKKLKAAGWTKPTEFAWIHNPRGENWSIGNAKTFNAAEILEWYYTPTAEEILRELPIELTDDAETPLELVVVRDRTYWYVGYAVSEEVTPFSEEYHDKSLSEAAAQMWIWCVERGYIKTEAKP